MIRAAYGPGLLVISVLLLLCACSIGQPTSKTEGCVKDDECKGERICEDGVCVDPDGGDGDSETMEGDSADDPECTGDSCGELLAFCEYVCTESCDPVLGVASSMQKCVEYMMSYRDSGCFDGINLMTCLGGCAERSKSCQYVEMCTEDCISQYCI